MLFDPKKIFTNMLAIVIIHELMYEFCNSYFGHIPMSLISNESHCEYI